MKRFYLALAALAISLTGMAQTYDIVAIVTENLQRPAQLRMDRYELTPAQQKILQEKLNAPAATPLASPAGNWRDLGNAKYKDPLFKALQTDADYVTWEVPAQQNEQSPTWLRLVSPYAQPNPYSGAYQNVQEMLWDFDCTDPNKVKPEVENCGILISQGIGQIIFWPMYEVLTELGRANEITDDMYGKFSNQTITFSGSAMMYYAPEVDPEHFYGLSAFTIEFPGALSYSTVIDLPYCAPDNNFVIAVTSTPNIAKHAVGLFKGAYPASAANIDYVVKNPAITTDRTSFKLSFAPTAQQGTSTHDIYSIFVIGLDEKDQTVTSEVKYAYACPTDHHNWKAIGTGRLTDNFIAGYFLQKAVTTHNVTVEENINTPGYYRVLNPYENWAHSDDNTHDNDHNHYLYINATNPNQVYVEECLPGVNMGMGDIRLSSIPYNQLINGGAVTTSLYGKKTNQTITFPAKSVVISERDYKDGAWAYTNANQQFALEVPQSNAVGNIAADATDATPEYFTLQGMRIDNPVPGQVIIERRGNTVTKTTVK